MACPGLNTIKKNRIKKKKKTKQTYLEPRPLPSELLEVQHGFQHLLVPPWQKTHPPQYLQHQCLGPHVARDKALGDGAHAGRVG